MAYHEIYGRVLFHSALALSHRNSIKIGLATEAFFSGFLLTPRLPEWQPACNSLSEHNKACVCRSFKLDFEEMGFSIRLRLASRSSDP